VSIKVRSAFLSLAIVLVAASAAMCGPTDVEWLVGCVQSVLPPTWRIVEADSARVPIGWTGEASGLYVEVEDTRTRFFHPNGFHYYSFYRVWLMPSSWEGEMRMTPYVSDSAPAYLLGASDDWLVFYHTAGGNVWYGGLTALCAALGLDRICYAETENRIVDLSVEERLSKAAHADGGFLLSPNRIVGLTGEGPNLYLEYVFPPPQEDDAAGALSDLTARLAEAVFGSLPEVESLYLRRCTVDSFTDTIVQRD
jgi:hypothetical protein